MWIKIKIIQLWSDHSCLSIIKDAVTAVSQELWGLLCTHKVWNPEVCTKNFLSRQDSNPELWGFAPKLGVWSARPPFKLDTDKSFEPFGFKHRALGLRPKAGCIVQVRSSRLIQTSRGFRTLRVRTPSCGASPHSSEFDVQDRPSSLIQTEELRTLRVQTQIPSCGASPQSSVFILKNLQYQIVYFHSQYFLILNLYVKR